MMLRPAMSQILKDNEQKVMAVTQFLLDHEVMSGEQFRQCMQGEEITAEAGETAMFDQQPEKQ